jgi:hypothetical protein
MAKVMTLSEFRQRVINMGRELEEMKTGFHRNVANLAHRKRVQGMEASIDVDGNPFDALEPSTIRKKSGEHKTMKMYRKKKGGPTGLASRKVKASATPEKPMIDTGAMKNTRVEADSTEGRVIMARSRSERISTAGSIAKIHQDGAGNNPERRHWGFYPGVREEANKRYRRLIRAIVKKAAGG